MLPLILKLFLAACVPPRLTAKLVYSPQLLYLVVEYQQAQVKNCALDGVLHAIVKVLHLPLLLVQDVIDVGVEVLVVDVEVEYLHGLIRELLHILCDLLRDIEFITMQATTLREIGIVALLAHEMLKKDLQLFRFLDEFAHIHHQVIPNLLANIVVGFPKYLRKNNLQLHVILKVVLERCLEIRVPLYDVMVHQPQLLLLKNSESIPQLETILINATKLRILNQNPLLFFIYFNYLVLDTQIIDKHTLKQRTKLQIRDLLRHLSDLDVTQVDPAQQVVQLVYQLLVQRDHAKPIE